MKLIFILLLTLSMTSCFKTNQAVNPAHLSILQFIAQDPSLTILNAAILRVRLDTLMSSGGPYTFFAPTDPSFRAVGLTMDSINKMDATRLQRILAYGVVNGRVSADALPGFLKQQFTSLHPVYKPFLTKSYYGIFINGIPVTDGNHELGDGIVQVIGRVPFPPSGTQLDALRKDPDMSFFAALVSHVYVLNLMMADPDPNCYFTGYSTYVQTDPTFGNTMLVPTDSAFRAYGYPDSASLYNDSINVVYGSFSSDFSVYYPALLSRYDYNGFIFTCDLKGGFAIAGGSNIGYRSQAGSQYSYIVTSADGMSLTGNGISPLSPVKIIGPDIIASNGVIQKINQVFISHP